MHKRLVYLTVTFCLVLASGCTKEGSGGSAGAQGPVGPQGPAGPQGVAGPVGSQILSGQGAPADTLGSVGDFYIDNPDATLYGPKAISGWGTPTSLKGATGATGTAGAAGSQIISGDATPVSTLGNAGDYYFDNVTDSLYGPKTTLGWGFAVSLRGAPGATGSANVISYNWVAFNGGRWGPYTDSPVGYGYRLYQVELPALTSNIVATGTVLTYLAYASTKGADTTAYFVSPEPGNFINYSISWEYTQTMSIVMQPGAIYYYIANLGYSGDPGTLGIFDIPFLQETFGWYYRIIIIPSGVVGTGVGLSYREVCARYGIKP